MQVTAFCVKNVPDAEVNVTPGGSVNVTAPAMAVVAISGLALQRQLRHQVRRRIRARER